MLSSLKSATLALLAITPATLAQRFVSGGPTTTAAPCVPTYTYTTGSSTAYTTITATQPRPFVWTSTPLGYCGFTDPSPTPPNFALSTQTQTPTCASTTLTTGVDVLTETVVSYICPRSPCTMTRVASGPCPTPTASSTGVPHRAGLLGSTVSTGFSIVITLKTTASDNIFSVVQSTILDPSAFGQPVPRIERVMSTSSPVVVVIGSVPITITSDATLSILPFNSASSTTFGSNTPSTGSSAIITTTSAVPSITTGSASESALESATTSAAQPSTTHTLGNTANIWAWEGMGGLVLTVALAWAGLI